MSETILKVENLSKQYRLGTLGTGTISHDLNRWWASIRGKEDPYLKVGETNDRSKKAISEYVWALKDINFEVKRGEVLGIIGKNGAGKSTLLKILSKVTGPSTGSIKSRGRIASLLEVGTGFHPEMTGRENIFLNGAILGMTKKEINDKIDEIIAFSGCERYIDTPTKRYSSGMTVRLAFAVAAFLEPDILIVDEVLAVGDAEFQKKAIGKMQDISNTDGRTVLFVSHNMAAVKNLCTRGIVLENGVVIFEGDVEESVNRYLSNIRTIERVESIITDIHRKKNTPKNIEFLKITSKNNILSVRSPIDLKIHIKNNKSFKENICVTGTICNNQENEMGSFFTNSFNMVEEEMVVDLSILNHNLSIGEYYFNFSISKGSFQNSNLEVLDHCYEAIGFEILKNSIDDDDELIQKWNRSWGNLYFDSKIIINNEKIQ